MSLPTLSPDNKKMINSQISNLGNAVISSTNNSNIPENNISGNANNLSISSQNKSESRDSTQNNSDTKQIEIIGNDAKKLQDLAKKNTNNNSNKSRKNLPKNNNLTKKKNNNNKKDNDSNESNEKKADEPPVDEHPVDEPPVDEPIANEPSVDEPIANEPSVDESVGERNVDTNISKGTEEDEEDKPDLENTTTNEITNDINVITGKNVNNTTKKELMASLNKLTMNLLNHQVVMKLFHFQTTLYGAHKASDSYSETFASTMDKLLEIAQGIYGKITLKKFSLMGSSHTDENIIKHLDGIIILLRNKINDILGENTELISVRDELLGNVEQLKYLLTFK
jgi:hypothetical protein